MAMKRRTPGGKWEYVIKRARLLDKPIYLTYEDETEGDTYVASLEALLDRGVVPHEYQQQGTKYALLAELIADYLTQAQVSDPDKKILNVIYARVGKTALRQLTYAWVEGWIGDMKMRLNLKPGTIRHHVGALARCFDWAGRRCVVPLVLNPIRQLPRNYAQYSERDVQLARAANDDHGRQEDAERDRRLEAGEEDKIRQILDRQKPEGRERPLALCHQGAVELLFDLALETAMRMREMFTLTMDQVDLANKTIFLDKTKNGDKRQVPLSSVALTRIRQYQAQVAGEERGMEGFSFKQQRLFPWWNGSFDRSELARVTALLSRQYARIFAAAGCANLRFHDLRHEATSRLFERTQLQEFEIMKITGHSSTRMLKRYSNLRGSDLAKRLW